MPTVDSVLKTVRIPREEWEEIERTIEAEGISFCSYVRGLKRPRVENGMSEALKDLKSMMKCFHATLDDGIRAFQRGLEDGTLTYRKGRINATSGYENDLDVSGFLEACTVKQKDPQETLDRFTRMLRNT